MLLFALFYLIVLLSLLSRCFSADAAVSCALQQSCVLPCSFEPGPDPVIHWTKEPHDQTPVHIYLRGQYQPWHQHQNFRGRTSLFEEGLSTGNASLRLSGAKVQDEGKYKCFANALNTDKTTEVYVDVTVYAAAPVSLQPQGQQLLCSSEGVDPKPSVSWSPPSSAARTTLTPSEGGVWSVHSSVPLPHSPPHQYSCNVSDSRGRWRSATYRRDTLIYHTDGSDYVVLPCTEPSAPVKSLIWSFNQNQTILSRSGPEPVYTESWTQFVVRVTKSNSLILKNLTKEQLGLFSCELCTEQQNFIIQTEVTEAEGKRSHLWIITVVFIVLFIIVLLWWLYLQKRRAQERFRRKTPLERDEEKMHPERDEEMMHQEREEEMMHQEREEEMMHLKKDEEMMHPERDEEMMHLKRDEEKMHLERMKMMMHPERDEEMMHLKRDEVMMHLKKMKMMTHQERDEVMRHLKRMEMMMHPERDEEMMHPERDEVMMHLEKDEEKMPLKRDEEKMHPERDEEKMHLKRDEEKMHPERMEMMMMHLKKMEMMMMHLKKMEMMMMHLKRMEMMIHQEGDEDGDDDAPEEDEEMMHLKRMEMMMHQEGDEDGDDDDAPEEDEEMRMMMHVKRMEMMMHPERMKMMMMDLKRMEMMMMRHLERMEMMMHPERMKMMMHLKRMKMMMMHLKRMKRKMHQEGDEDEEMMHLQRKMMNVMMHLEGDEGLREMQMFMSASVE